MYIFARKALDLALGWPKHDESTLGDLVERLDGMCDQDRSAVWDLIESWSQDGTTDDQARAVLRERIRRSVLTRLGQHRHPHAETRDKARDMYERLAPRDPVIRHAWLFADTWVQESSDEIEDGALDMEKLEKREAWVHQRRTEAMKEIWDARGLDGAVALMADSNAPSVVGRFAALHAKDRAAATEVLQVCLFDMPVPDFKIDAFMTGFIKSLDDSVRPAVLMAAAKGVASDQGARLFRCAAPLSANIVETPATLGIRGRRRSETMRAQRDSKTWMEAHAPALEDEERSDEAPRAEDKPPRAVPDPEVLAKPTRRQGSLQGLTPNKRGAKPAQPNPLSAKVRQLEAKVARLEKELATAHTILEVQGKVAGLLGFCLNDGKDC